jgi:hypothetical protein
MMLESLRRIRASFSAFQVSAFCSQPVSLLESSCSRHMSQQAQVTTRYGGTTVLNPSVASLKRDFLESVRGNDKDRAQQLRQRLTEASKDRCVKAHFTDHKYIGALHLNDLMGP